MNWTTTTPIPDEFIKGALELERTAQGILPHRLPAKARAQANNDPQLLMAESQPSGVRVAFRTDATELELETMRSRATYSGAPARPDGIIELVVNKEVVGCSTTSGGNTTTIDMATGVARRDVGAACTSRFANLPEGAKDVELWLPHNETTELIALRANAPLEVAPPNGLPVWLHHGSSISHGSNATRPTATWPAVAARRGGVELVNLGFGGSALLDPFTARTMRDTRADVISIKIGINLVNLDLMRLRAFGPAVHGFLDTIRDGHPTTPLLVISPIHCAIHEDTPGPGAFDMEALAAGRMQFMATGDPAETAAGKLTLRVIRGELERIVRERSASDGNLHHLDGQELYGGADAVELPLSDALHPDAATHQLMGERYAQLAFAAGAPLSRSEVSNG
ncbi:SGNH/GDSL hydrolase family protein [Arthrobacter sp. H35-D1]|uniref:SGNH/GDSL hydrolase family protein n=1 Tax=Arthrobacter sp. H35-D1 TaxID=3046202 RepID=UPI0024BA988B|nr:SGNH/GDSL hydrolase family protein [Arthrobacter sp. H35-D1]MDJ0313463.1 SGNH/GDSL hydrolase family protein [Arthrobacter sp. H35-D1]